MSASTDPALGLLCRLLERSVTEVDPDTVRYSGYPEVYERLLDLQALSPAGIVTGGLLCPWCGSEPLHLLCFHQGGYQGCCNDCGWQDLTPFQVTQLRLDPPRIARWLAAALGLTPRFQVQDLVPNHLWRLGEIEHRRKRYTLLFGRRLNDGALAVAFSHAIQTVAAPGAGVLITPTALEALPESLGDCRIVPLRAVAHLRKAGFVIENLEVYLDQLPPLADGNAPETSLRHLRSGGIAWVDGEQIKVPPQPRQFLFELLEAGGRPVTKRRLADRLEIPVEDCVGSKIFRRCKVVYLTFVAHDDEGRYWVKAEYVLPAEHQ